MPGNLHSIVNSLHAAGLLRLALKLLALVSAGHIVMSPPAAGQHMFAANAVAHVFAGAAVTRSATAMRRIVRQALANRTAATNIQAAVRGWLARCLRKCLLVLYVPYLYPLPPDMQWHVDSTISNLVGNLRFREASQLHLLIASGQLTPADADLLL
jgi:hypothetical protein